MKIQIALILILTSIVSAEDVFVQKDGNTLSVQQGSRTTVVEGASPRAAGQLVGEAAKAASGIGLGIADAFGAKTGQTADVRLERRGGYRGETNRIVVDQGRSQGQQIVGANTGQMPREEPGRTMSGVYTISIAGSDGTASSYQGATNVEIFKDGQVYNEQAGSIQYTGSVKFTSINGEQRSGRGVIGLAKEID